MKKPILYTVFAGVLLAATVVSAQDAPRSPRSNAPNYVPPSAATPPTAETNTPAPAPQPEQPAPSSSVTPQPAAADQAPPAPASATNAPTNVTLPNGEKGLVMNFRGVPLEQVLTYMSEAAGLVINPDNRVDVNGKVNLWSAKPVSIDDAVKLLKQMLNDNGYTAIQNDRLLTIMRADEANKSDIPVFNGNDPARIPKTPMIVTQIIPVHSLNVVQLVKNLQQLLPSNAIISADESANSIVLTDTQANIHRMVEIITALDSVTSGNATIRVFTLRFADSKALAQLIKDLFPSPDTQGQGGSPFGRGFGRFRGMMGAMMAGGGMPGGPGGDNGGENNGHTPTAKVSAVSDDHANAVVVSAPDELMPTIVELVEDLDKPVDDTTVAKIYQLRNADPTEMANLLTSLFTDDTNQSDASRSPFGFGRFAFPGMGQQNNAAAGLSDRMKRMAHVSAVADPRTQELIVTCGTNMIDQIDNIVKTLDASDARKIQPFYISLDNADPADVLPILQSLFPQMTGMNNSASSAYNASQNPFTTRSTSLLQTQNNQSSSSSGGFGSMGSGSGSRF